jgi:Contractile injection system tube protein
VERVAFLIEQTGERFGCLLNPDSLVVRRAAGIRPRSSAGGIVTGAGLADDPVLLTGGGRTELEMDLLFDISLAGSTVETDNVRDLTRPLWSLAENGSGAADGYGVPPLVRFIWGKVWNLPGFVTAVAERFERFGPSGTPERSWMRLRLLRASTPATATDAAGVSGEGPTGAPPQPFGGPVATGGAREVDVHEVVSGERMDEIAARYYGDPAWWRALAAYNGVADPASLPPPQFLQIPPLTELQGQA